MPQPSTQEKQEPATPRDATTLSGAFHDMALEAIEIRKAASDWLETRADAAKAYLRRAFLMTALGIALLVATLSAVVTIVVMFLNGIATGFGRLLGDRLWLGQILTAVGVVLAVYLGLRAGAKRAQGRRLDALVLKYEQKEGSESLAASSQSNATTATS